MGPEYAAKFSNFHCFFPLFILQTAGTLNKKYRGTSVLALQIIAISALYQLIYLQSRLLFMNANWYQLSPYRLKIKEILTIGTGYI